MAEETKEDDFITAKFRLKDNDKNGEFRPLVIDYKSHPALKGIVKAFNNSNTIPTGLATIVKDKGIQKPTMKGKDVYLTGGALRDHLKNKMIDEYDLATNASPDEIRAILRTDDADLTEVKPPKADIQVMAKYKNLPDMEHRKKVFYASRWDSDHHEMEFTIVIDGKKSYLATFNLNNKNRMLTPKKRVFVTTPEEDSKSRDITINALYLKLKTDDGENGELLDPHGGMFDLKAGRIVLVKNSHDPLAKDPYLPFRLANVSARFSFDKKIPKDILDMIKESKGKFEYDNHVLKRYYLGAIENPDVPVDYYLKNLIDAEIASAIFPDCVISDPANNIPNSKIIATAFILQKNMPSKVEHTLNINGWSKTDIENIVKFIKLAHFCNSNYINPHLIYDFFSKPFGMPNHNIKQFLDLMKKSEIYEKVFAHDFADIMKKYVDNGGRREINPEYVRFLGRVPRTDELESVREKLFDREIKKIL